jgi:branched-chain amino acid aminotransferase
VDGYDEPILLNDQGSVTEAPLRNIFIVRNGVLITPDLASGILEGVTRDTILELARDELNLRVEERRVDRTELYVADEVFFASSSVEILPVLSVDRLPVGNGHPGPIAGMVYHALTDVGYGRTGRYRHWLTPVYERVGEDTGLPHYRRGL